MQHLLQNVNNNSTQYVDFCHTHDCNEKLESKVREYLVDASFTLNDASENKMWRIKSLHYVIFNNNKEIVSVYKNVLYTVNQAVMVDSLLVSNPVLDLVSKTGDNTCLQFKITCPNLANPSGVLCRISVV